MGLVYLYLPAWTAIPTSLPRRVFESRQSNAKGSRLRHCAVRSMCHHDHRWSLSRLAQFEEACAILCSRHVQLACRPRPSPGTCLSWRTTRSGRSTSARIAWMLLRHPEGSGCSHLRQVVPRCIHGGPQFFPNTSMSLYNIFIYNIRKSTSPGCSMYGLFAYIWVVLGVNVGKYTPKNPDPFLDYDWWSKKPIPRMDWLGEIPDS